MMRKWYQLILAVLILYWQAPSLAEPVQNYQFEVIVFSHITSEGLTQENWPALEPILIPANAADLIEGEILPPNQWRLKAIQQNLQSNHNQILLHLAWQENIKELRPKKTLHLYSEKSNDNNDQQLLNGTLAINLQHYFNLYFNLDFLLPGTPDRRFELRQGLRMRSNELNYIDHPLYGIVIEIFPLLPNS